MIKYSYYIHTHVYDMNIRYAYTFGWFGLILWHINHFRLFNAKSMFIHI